MRPILPVLAALLTTLASAADGSPAAGDPSPEVLAHGERVMRRFCLSCHGSPGGAVDDPLGPRLRPETWGDPEQAYAHVGALARVNRRMDQPFTGSDDDRRALARWLAHRASMNRPSPIQRAAPWLAAAAGIGALAAVAVAIRRRAARS